MHSRKTPKPGPPRCPRRARGRAPVPGCPPAAPSRRRDGRGGDGCGAGPRQCWRVAKNAERPHHRDSAHRIELVEHRLEFAFRVRVAIPAKADRVLPRALDQVENRLALLLPQRVAQHAPEQADYLPSAAIPCRLHPDLRSVHVSDSVMVSPRRTCGMEKKRSAANGAHPVKQTLRPPAQGFLFPGNSRH